MRPADTPGPDIFVSYSSRDRPRVRAVANSLETAGLDIWLDQSRIQGGSNYGIEIVRNIKRCGVFVLMCSDASLRSRNVKQEVQLAWKYGRPLLPLLLEQTSFPEQLEYWLEGSQWIEVLDAPDSQWLPPVLDALGHAGLGTEEDLATRPGGQPAQGPEVVPCRLSSGLEGLRAVARFSDQIWPVPAGRAATSRHAGLRDLGAPQESVDHGYRLGSRVQLVIESDRPTELLLLDEGTSGKIYCLCPSLFAPTTRLEVGRNTLPQPDSPYDAFSVTGEPGREHLLAILTETPLDLPWLPGSASQPARVLEPADVNGLLARLQDLEGSRWTAIATFFDVLE